MKYQSFVKNVLLSKHYELSLSTGIPWAEKYCISSCCRHRRIYWSKERCRIFLFFSPEKDAYNSVFSLSYKDGLHSWKRTFLQHIISRRFSITVQASASRQAFFLHWQGALHHYTWPFLSQICDFILVFFIWVLPITFIIFVAVPIK